MGSSTAASHREHCSLRNPVLSMEESGPRIVFICKSDCDSYETLHGLLKRAGCQVLAARTATAGFSLVRSQEFEMVVLDWPVGEPSGIHLCRALRALVPKAPIFFFSYIPYRGVVDMALEAGASGVFAKPGEIGALLSAVAASSGATLNIEAPGLEMAEAV
ncbi:MAG TPA: response regulator [Blastocatellia bacterium]